MRASDDGYVLTLDIGTSSVRALLYDLAGNAVDDVHAQQSYALRMEEPGEVAVEPAMLMQATCLVIDEALAAAGERAARIVAVATDTFWHSLIALDEHDQPLTTVITWADTRPSAAAQELEHRLAGEAIHRRTGARLHASYWPAKLLWLSQHDPQAYERAASFVSFGEYFHRQLFGRAVCSLCMASGTGLLLTREQKWDMEQLHALGLSPERLPPLGDLDESLRGLVPAYASRWPALRDVPWFPALGDGATANVGSGCVASGRVALTVGTSSAVRVCVAPDAIEPPDGLWLYLLDARRAIFGGALSEGGNLVAWLEHTLRLEDLDTAQAAASSLPPDGHGLTVLPYLSGERSTGWHGSARATIAGLAVHTTPEEILRAGIESLAYRIAVVFRVMEKALGTSELSVIASGGTLENSPLLRQIIADAVGLPVSLLLDREASARGGALLALEALGVIDNVARIQPQIDSVTQPDSARGAIYQRAIDRQNRLYQLLLDSPGL